MGMLLMVLFFFMLAALMIPLAGVGLTWGEIGAGILFISMGLGALYAVYRLLGEDR